MSKSASETAEDMVADLVLIIDMESNKLMGPGDGPEMERIAIECAKYTAQKKKHHNPKFWKAVLAHLEVMYENCTTQ